MKQKAIHVFIVVYLIGTVCLVNAKHIPRRHIQRFNINNNSNNNASYNKKKSENNNIVLYNKCSSDSDCVHGACSLRTRKCLCNRGWNGEKCNNSMKGSVSLPRKHSKQIRRKVNREPEHAATGEKGLTLSKSDKYVAELLTTFFPRLRNYFRKIFALIPRRKNSNLPVTLKQSPINNARPASKGNRKAQDDTKTIRRTPKHERNFSENNLVKGTDVRGIVKSKNSAVDKGFGKMRNAKKAARNDVNNITKTHVVSRNNLPRRFRQSRNKVSMTTVKKNFSHRDNKLALNSIDKPQTRNRNSVVGSNSPNVPISPVNIHPTIEVLGIMDEVIEEADTDDACKANYKLRPLAERMCAPGLVCKYGACSRDHRGSYIAFECACDPGAKGLMCDTKCCLDCGGNGRCSIYYDGSEQCDCRRGYYGPQCERSESEIRYANPHISPLISIRNALANVLK